MTYNIELADKPGSTGLHHVMIRLHQAGHRPARIQFSHEVEKRHWNPKKTFGKWVRSSHIYADTLNADIERSYTQVKEAVKAMLAKEPHLSPKDCKLRYESGGTSTPYKTLVLAALNRENVSKVTIKDNTHVLNAFFEAYGEDITIEQITPALLASYRQKLIGKGLKNSSINHYMSMMRSLYEHVQQARGISRRELLVNSPFLDIKKLKDKSAPKGRLRESGIAALKSRTYTFFENTGKRSGMRPKFIWTDWGCWCWLACFYQAGMRIGDLIRSRYEWYETDTSGNPIRLRYRMQKNGKAISVKLNAEAIAHLKLIWKPQHRPEDYLLPFLDAKASYFPYRTYEQIRAMPMENAYPLNRRIASLTGQLNKAVRAVATELNIEIVGGKLSNHSARHSMGDAIVRAMKAGKPVTMFDFQALFGHSSVRTTEGYLGELDESSLDSAVDAVFGMSNTGDEASLPDLV